MKLSGPAVAASERPVEAIVCVHAKGMEEPWCQPTSLGDATARDIVDADAKRWTIEPSFRDTEDIIFGTEVSLLRISRRDRSLLLNAFAISNPVSASATHSPTSARAACPTNSITTTPEVRFQPRMRQFAEVMQRSGAIQRPGAIS